MLNIIGSQEKVKVTQSCPPLWDPMDYIVHGILQARILEWVAFPFSRVSSQPRDQTQVSHNAGGFFTSWATGKPKNTGVSSLSLLQGIFLTQESNRGLLHCRQILYQLSYEGRTQENYKLKQWTTTTLEWMIKKKKTHASQNSNRNSHSLLVRMHQTEV